VSYHPYWSRAVQNQQKAQPKPQGKTQRQQQQLGSPKGKRLDDFGHEWLDKVVEAEQVKGTGVVVIRGRVIDVSKYWLKMAVDGQTLYVNKAFILSIKPLEMKSGAPGGNDGRESPRSR
jgi:hypothetical protein